MRVANSAPIRVLYVEDDEIIQSVASEALRDAGFEVVEAMSGDQAMVLLHNPDHFDVLFTDVRLPGGLDGIELAHETRKVYPSLPVFIASAYAARVRERLRDLDPPAIFMAKPYSLAKMVATIRGLTQP